MITIQNRKTGETIQIDETNPKMLAKYGIKIPKSVKKMDLGGLGTFMSGIDNSVEGNIGDPMITEATKAYSPNYSLEDLGINMPQQNDFTQNQPTTSADSPINFPNILSNNQYVQRIGQGVKAIADGTNNGNDAQAAAGVVKTALATGAGVSNFFGDINQRKIAFGQENKNKFNQIDGLFTQPYLASNVNQGSNNNPATYAEGGFKQTSNMLNSGISKFTGKKHYEGGIPINTDQPFNHANDLKINRDDANLEVETGEYYVPMAKSGGAFVASDVNKLGRGGKSPAKLIEIRTKEETGVSANKLTTKLSKREKFIDDNKSYLSNSLLDGTSESMSLLSVPLIEQHKIIAKEEVFAQEKKKRDMGKPNDLASFQMKYGGNVKKMDVGGVTKEEFDNFIKTTKEKIKTLPNQWDRSKTQRDFVESTKALRDMINNMGSDLTNEQELQLENEIRKPLSTLDQAVYRYNSTKDPKEKEKIALQYPMVSSSVTNPGNTNMTPFQSTPQSRKKASWWGDRKKLEDLMANFESQTGTSFPYYAPNVSEDVMASDYQKAFIKTNPQIITNLFKNKALPFTNKAVDIYNKQNKTKGQPSEQELNKFFAKNPNLITEQFGDALWGERGVEMLDLPFNSQQEFDTWKQDKDWLNMGNNYYYDSSGENDTPIVYRPKLNFTPAQKQERPSDPITPNNYPTTVAEGDKKGKRSNTLIPRIGNTYPIEPIQKLSLTPYDYNPNLINPQAQINEITRGNYIGNTTTDRSKKAQEFTNDYAAIQNIMGSVANQNTQLKNQASQINNTNRQNINQLNLGYGQTFLDNIAQRNAVVTQQQMIDNNAYTKALTDQNHEASTIEYLKTAYPTEFAAMMANQPVSRLGKAKYGGKIKLKPKKKK